jgi:thiamine kinase-like enzyme
MNDLVVITDVLNKYFNNNFIITLFNKVGSHKKGNRTYKIEYNNKYYSAKVTDNETYNTIIYNIEVLKKTNLLLEYLVINNNVFIQEWIEDGHLVIPNESEYIDIIKSIKTVEGKSNKNVNDYLKFMKKYINKTVYSIIECLYSYFNKNLKKCFCHGDLMYNNILYKDRFYIIDLDLCMYDYELYELTNLGIFNSYNDDDIERILKNYDTYMNNILEVYKLSVIFKCLLYALGTRIILGKYNNININEYNIERYAIEDKKHLIPLIEEDNIKFYIMYIKQCIYYINLLKETDNVEINNIIRDIIKNQNLFTNNLFIN